MQPTAALGRFIALEGPDGAGKSLQAAHLADALRASGHVVMQTREPGGTALGERIRDVLLATGDAQRTPESDALLFNAARSQLVHEVIRPALERGEIVLCDRFAGSTLAYQGYGSGLDLAELRRLEVLATGGLRPDLVILLDVPVEVGLARRARGAARELTRFETSPRHDAAFHERVRAGYLKLAAADPGRWHIIDAAGDAGAVTDQIIRSARELLERSEPYAALLRTD